MQPIVFSCSGQVRKFLMVSAFCHHREVSGGEGEKIRDCRTPVVPTQILSRAFYQLSFDFSVVFQCVTFQKYSQILDCGVGTVLYKIDERSLVIMCSHLKTTILCQGQLGERSRDLLSFNKRTSPYTSHQLSIHMIFYLKTRDFVSYIHFREQPGK